MRSLVLAVLLCSTVAGLPLVVAPDLAVAARPLVSPSLHDAEEWNAFLESTAGGANATSREDTVWVGGDGLGNVVRYGEWDWETLNPAMVPEMFPNGEPVGNAFADGWIFEDRTTRSGPNQVGSGHWKPDGTYDFAEQGLSFAHRATFHTNDGANDGPDPLQGNWSLWIGTNLLLNPEHCGWEQSRGHGNGWSQGFKKRFPGAGGATHTLSFFHRYAVEAEFDTNWIEISTNASDWFPAGNGENPVGIYAGGNAQNPQPSASGGSETVAIPAIGAPGSDLWVRFRLASDPFLSDESGGGDFLWSWQVDDIQLDGGTADSFEGGLDGWEPARFEGFDYDITGSLQAAGRIAALATVQCGYDVPCPEGCGLTGNVLLFTNTTSSMDCGLNDAFQDSYATSPAFSIGGFENDDIDGRVGRVVRFDIYQDGGSGSFETGAAICWVHSPFDMNSCPYTPTAGDPGAGRTWNWSRTGFTTCDFFDMGTGPDCFTGALDDVSAHLPAEADSVILHVGVFSQCRSVAGCVTDDNGAPYLDNISFGVFDPDGVSINAPSLSRYCDSFPLAEYADDLGLPPLTDGIARERRSRADGAWDDDGGLGGDFRFVRADTAYAETGAQDAAVFLRFRVRPSVCQTDQNSNPFFLEYPPNQWHEARMDTGEAPGHGSVTPNTYMTCYHEDDPLDGTHWNETFQPIEPCDDILSDNLFVSGTEIDWFMEVRDEATGEVIGTAPSGRNFLPIDATAAFEALWRKTRILPQMIGPGCDPENPVDRANTILLVYDNMSMVQRTRMRALMDSFNLGYDEYLTMGTNYSDWYNTIGRREDQGTQPPRPPLNGATAAQLDPYRCIWYDSYTSRSSVVLTDELTAAWAGGQPARDMQALEQWLDACTPGDPRFLILSGYGWASDAENNTETGPTFLANRGVVVVTDDYEELTGDLRRCARVTGTGALGLGFDGEFFGSGCPEDNRPNVDVFATTAGGVAVANFVESGGAELDDCLDDVDRPDLVAMIANAPSACERTWAIAAPLVRTHDLKCDTEACLFTDFTITGELAQLFAGMWSWAGKPIGEPISVDDPELAPGLATQLIGARPNPANPAVTLTFSLAQKGKVRLRIFDVSGRLVRTLIDDVIEAANEPFELTWDGRNEGGQRTGSGVYFYQLDAPGYTASKKLVMLK